VRSHWGGICITCIKSITVKATCSEINAEQDVIAEESVSMHSSMIIAQKWEFLVEG